MPASENNSLHKARPEREILDDLSILCQSRGFVHALSFLCWSNNFIHYADRILPEDLSPMKSPEHLLRSEISLLIGLMVKAQMDMFLPSADIVSDYATRADSLLTELHSSMSAHFYTSWAERKENINTENSLSKGIVLREPIFYSGEAAYFFQYRDLSVQRYGRDEKWIIDNKGFSPSSVRELISAISEQQLEKFQYIRENTNVEEMDKLTLLPAFTVRPRELAQKSGLPIDVIENIISAFSLKKIPCNELFDEVGGFNEANAYPFLPVAGNEFLLFQTYTLAESFYESPDFWMRGDPDYSETSKTNRGIFTEKFSKECLMRVFGEHRVFENVYIMDGKNRLGEIDVLVVFADRAIVLQAKSKKLTEQSRKGSDDALEKDFKAAIQSSYDQGYRCAKYLIDQSKKICDKNGNLLNIRRNFNEIFLFCVVSDSYPALAFQSGQFLKTSQNGVIRQPYVMDIFFLDVLSEILDEPLRFLNFLHQRIKYGDRVNSQNELSILSFHLKYNLWFSEEYNYINLGEDFSVHLDASMLARRENLPGNRVPDGILIRLVGTKIDEIIKEISKVEADNVIEIVYAMFEFSEEAAEEFSNACEYILRKTSEDRKFHDFSMGLGPFGFSVNAVAQFNEDVYARMIAQCKIAKYRQKADRWFGLSLSPAGDRLVQCCVGLNDRWKQEPEMDKILEALPQPKTGRLSDLLPYQK